MIPCPDCDDGTVIDYTRHDRGLSSGAPTTCSTCGGARVAHCWWRLVCRGLPATRIADGQPACEGCAEEVGNSTDTAGDVPPRFFSLSARLAKAHPEWTLARVQAEAMKTLAAMEARS